MSNQATPSTSRLSVLGRLYETRAGDKAILVQLTPSVAKTQLLQSADRPEAFQDLEEHFSHYVVSDHDAQHALEVIESDAPSSAVYADKFAAMVGTERVDSTFGTQGRQCACIVNARSSTEACITMPIYIPSRDSVCKAEQLANSYESSGSAKTMPTAGRKRNHLEFTIHCANNQIRVIARLLRIPSLTEELKCILVLRSARLHKQVRRLEAIAALHANVEEL